MTVEYTLRNALLKLDSDKAKDRATSLEALKNILSDDRNIREIDNVAWKAIFESFCRCVEKQKEIYLTKLAGTGKTQQTATAKAEKILMELAQDFRWLCERAQHRLNLALVKPILEHILSVLPHHQALFKPLAVQYTRALRQILSRKAYRDHIPSIGWEALVNLCLKGLMVESEDQFGTSMDDDFAGSPSSIPVRKFRRSVSTETVELARILALLVSGCPKDLQLYTARLLEFLGSYFRTHTFETPCHAPLLAITNHILFETAYELSSITEEFLVTTIPYLLVIWESRASAGVRTQLVYVLRFYLHTYDWSNVEETIPDREHHCLQLYEAIQRELGSKLGTNAAIGIDIFVSVLWHDWSKFAMLPSLMRENRESRDAMGKLYPSLAFVDLCAEIYISVLKIEEESSRRRINTHGDCLQRDRETMYSSSMKRTKRCDVLMDISRVLSIKNGNRDEKIGLLQILTLLFTKHSNALAEHQCETLLSLINTVLSTAEGELQGYALLCTAALGHSLGPLGITKFGGSTLWNSVWTMSWRLVTATTTIGEAAYYALETIVRARLVTDTHLVDAGQEIWKLMRVGSTAPTSSALHFLVAFLQWTTSNRSHTRGVQFFPTNELAQWICQSLPELERSISLDLIVASLLSLVGLRSSYVDSLSLNCNLIPVDIQGRDDYLSEWRLVRATRLWSMVTQEDLSGLSSWFSRTEMLNPLTQLSGITGNYVALLSVLEHELQKVISIWHQSRTTSASQGTLDTTSADIIEASLVLLLVCVGVLRKIFQVPDIDLPCMQRSTIVPLLTTLLRQLIDALSNLRRGAISERHLSLLKCLFDSNGVKYESGAMLPALNSGSSPSATETVRQLWPLPVDECVALAEIMALTVFDERIGRTPTLNNRQTSATSDEFNVLAMSEQSASSSHGTYLQLEYLYGSTSTTRTKATSARLAAIRALRSFYKNIGVEELVKDTTVRHVAILKLVVDGTPTDTEKVLHYGFDFVEFLHHAAKYLTADHCSFIMEQSVQLLSSYDSEKNMWVWAYIIRCLKAVLPALLVLNGNTVLMRQFDNLFAYFIKRVTSHNVPWIVSLEFGNLLLVYLGLDPNEELLSKCTGPDSSVVPILLGLLKHNHFLVRLFMGQSVAQIFSLHDSADHITIFEDVKEILTKTSVDYMHQLTNAIAFGEALISAPYHRVDIALALLEMARNEEAFHIVQSTINIAARRLSLDEGVVLLEELLPAVLWAWKGDIRTFPFRLLGYNSTKDFLGDYPELIMPKLLMANDFDVLGGEAGDLDGLIRKALPWTMAYILPALSRQGEDIEIDTVGVVGVEKAVAALQFIKGLIGEESFRYEVLKNTPSIVARLLQSTFDLSKPTVLTDISDYATAEGRLRQTGEAECTYDARMKSLVIGPSRLPVFDSRTVMKSLHYLWTICQEEQQGQKTDDICGFFVPARLQRILQILHEYLEKTRFAEDIRRLIFNGYRLLITLVTSAFMHPFLFQTTLQALLRCMKRKEVSLDCAELFLYLYSYAAAHAALLAQSTLTSIVPAVAQVLSSLLDAGELGIALALKSTLEIVLETGYKLAPDVVHLSVLQLDADIGIINDVRERFRVDNNEGDPELVVRLIDLAKFTPSARLAAVRFLRRALDTTDLAPRLAYSGDAASKLIGHLLAILRSAPGKRSLSIDIGHCLGRLSPFIGGRLTDCCLSRHAPFSEKATRKADEGHRAALCYLRDYLFDVDVVKVGVAVRTLRILLCSAAGLAALDNSEPDVVGYLDIFRGKAPRKVRILPTERDYPRIDVQTIWECEQMRPTIFDDKTFDLWIVRTVNSLLSSYPTDEFWANLGLAFETKPAFAELMLSYIVHAALKHEVNNTRKTIRKRSAMSLRTILSRQFRQIFGNAHEIHVRVLSLLLTVIEFLRKQDHPLSATPFDNNGWLDLDFLSVAGAAIVTGSFAAALLFLEISQEQDKRPWGTAVGITKPPSSGSEGVSTLLLNIYQSIGDSDGFEGVTALLGSEIPMDDPASLVQKYEHENAWDKIFNLRETQLKSVQRNHGEASLDVQIGLLRAMGHLGLHHVLETYISGSALPAETEISELYYESMWRNARWDIPSDRQPQGEWGNNQQLYYCLRALHNDDMDGFPAFISGGMALAVNGLRDSALQNTLNPFLAFRPLLILAEVDEMGAVQPDMPLHALQNRLHLWNVRLDKLSNSQSFRDLDPMLASRTCALKSWAQQHWSGRADGSLAISQTIMEALCTHFLMYTRIAREAGSLQIAQSAIAQLYEAVAHLEQHASADAKVPVDIEKLQAQAKLESLKILWARDDCGVATKSLKHFLQKHRSHATGAASRPLGKRVEADLLCHLGQWVSESRFEHPTNILQDYFEPAVQSAALANDTALLAKAHYHLAKFADGQYQEMLSNDPREQIKEHILYKQQEANACESLTKQYAGRDPNAAKKYSNTRDKMLLQIEMDRAEEARYMSDQSTFLEKCVENYLQTLEYGYTHSDMCIFRLCSLWFSNLEQLRINVLIDNYIDRIPSWKFLVLIYQLSARLTANPQQSEQQFQQVLQRLIQKVVRDHPHHTLFQIIALKNGGQLNAPASSSRSRRQETTPTVLAAQVVLKKLRSLDTLADLVVRLDLLCDAYIELAWRKVTMNMIKESRTLPLDKRSKILNMARSGIDLPIVTIDYPVKEDCRYDDLPHIKGFTSTFWVPGGINMPKVIECMGTDGKTYKQLVKGNDDLRQDAVLSKVFTIMNALLKQNLETRKRSLGIRTYKVLPLAPRCGIVEWVQNTAPIGEYLVRAHTSYNPGDWRHHECRNRMNEEHKSGNLDSKLALYRQIEANFHPVFRHFFFENFPDPLDWFERRLAYTRSVATSSIAGYVVGLGDRHAQNILIDQGTAEVIHIDLGIAFDQGRLLAVPELVPFRLTRDIVDGMGITGVEGAYRRCCEETMKILRNDSEVLLTILDVFRYDPLYNWKVTPMEQRRRQRMVDDMDAVQLAEDNVATDLSIGDRGQNKEAERALFVVKKKLSPTVSVECQINELIQSAVDARNLSRLFPGWQPW